MRRSKRQWLATVIAVSFVFASSGCSDDDPATGDIKTDPPIDVGEEVAGVDTTQVPDVGEAEPIPLNPYPENTVALIENNAVQVASATYQAQRAMSGLIALSSLIDENLPETLPASNAAALALTSETCSSGTGSVQATQAAFSGAGATVKISLNDCVSRGLMSAGSLLLTRYRKDDQDWTHVQAQGLSLQVDQSGSMAIVHDGRYRMQGSLEGSLSAVGDSLRLQLGDYELLVTPFESTVSAQSFVIAGSNPSAQNESANLDATHKFSMASELYGGTIFAKPSLPLELTADGLASSGGITIRGQASDTIEWLAGTSASGVDDSASDTVTDLRNQDGRLLLQNTWDNFLSVF